MDDFDLEQEEFSDVDYKSGTKGPWKKSSKRCFCTKDMQSDC